MKKAFLLLFGFLSMAAQAQTAEEDAIKATIQQLFDGMRKGDSTMVRATFHPTARLQSVGTNKEGKTVVQTEDISGFVKAVGMPHPVMWDERVLSYEIRIDDKLATAWTPYEFYAGDKFSHSGIDAFQLAKTDQGWKIIQLSDTRHRPAPKK
ncbi:MAG: nuclear transport factor 2 family protein [Spirosomataceae bacterium]